MSDKNTENLVDWANAPKIEDLKYDIEQASTSHNLHIANLDTWHATLVGDLKVEPAVGRSRVQPKTARKHAELRYPAIENVFLSSPDLFDVHPATHADVQAARENQLILNKQFNTDIPRVQFINNYSRTAINTGTVIVKVSWEEYSGNVRELVDVPVIAKTEQEKMDFLYDKVMDGSMTEEVARNILESGQELPIGTEKVLKDVNKVIVNRPVLEVKDSKNVIIDPTCRGDIDKANFIVDVFVTDLATLKKDGRYKNLDKIDTSIHTTHSDDLPMSLDLIDDTFEYADEPRKKFVVKEYWGYWDINNEGTVEPIVATFVGDVMIRLEKNPYPDGKLPFVVVKYLPSPDLFSVYGEPDIALLKDNQDIIGFITRGVLDLAARTANAQQGIARNLLDATNLKRFNTGQDFVFNPVPGGWEANYIQTSYPDVPRGAMDILALQNKEAESMTGAIPFAGGGVENQSLGTSATGIKSALDSTAKREAGILHRLSQGLIDIGKKIISMNSLWLTDEEIIRITDDEFVTINRATLAGQFDLRITVSTAEEDNAKAQELAFMLQTIGNNFDFNIVKMILTKIAELRKMPDLAKAIQSYEPQPDPVQQEIQAKQLELLNEQIMELRVKSQENMADIALKEAKAINERAKARNTESLSDLSDLEYLNNVTGLAQDRELELTQAKKKEEPKGSETKPKQNTSAKKK